MSQPLQQRAKDFLMRPIPKRIKYVKDSIAERIIATYAKNGSLKADGEMTELLELCVMETAAAVESHTGDAWRVFRRKRGDPESDSGGSGMRLVINIVSRANSKMLHATVKEGRIEA